MPSTSLNDADELWCYAAREFQCPVAYQISDPRMASMQFLHERTDMNWTILPICSTKKHFCVIPTCFIRLPILFIQQTLSHLRRIVLCEKSRNTTNCYVCTRKISIHWNKKLVLSGLFSATDPSLQPHVPILDVAIEWTGK